MLKYIQFKPNIINQFVILIFQTLTIAVKSSSDATDAKQQVSMDAELDIFAQPGQKIVAVYKRSFTVGSEVVNADTNLEIKSSGLGINIIYSDKSNLNKNSYSGEYSSHLKYKVGNINYEDILSLKGSKEDFKFLLKLYNTNLLKISSKLSLNKDHQTIDSEISSYDNLPILTHLEIKNFNTLLFTIGYKSK